MKMFFFPKQKEMSKIIVKAGQGKGSSDAQILIHLHQIIHEINKKKVLLGCNYGSKV